MTGLTSAAFAFHVLTVGTVDDKVLPVPFRSVIEGFPTQGTFDSDKLGEVIGLFPHFIKVRRGKLGFIFINVIVWTKYVP